MPIDIIMPALSPTMEIGSVAKWLIKEGDEVKVGDVLAEVETDKAIMELESVDVGVLHKIFAPDGSKDIKVGHVIAVILKKGETAKALEGYKYSSPVFSPDAAQNEPKQEEPQAQKSPINSTPKPILIAEEDNDKKAPIKKEVIEEINIRTSTLDKEHKASPLARRIASKRKISLSSIFGTGPLGRILKRDVETYSKSSTKSSNSFSGQMGRISSNQESQRIPMSGMRKVIAKRLAESKSTIPHFYLSADCDITRTLQLRSDLNNHFDNLFQNGKLDKKIKVSVNDIILKAIAIAVKENPSVNVYFGGDEIIQNYMVDICMAISLPEGLVAPKICDLNLKTLSTISLETKDVILRAKERKLAPSEMEGGSVSVSNLGMMGVDEFFPIVNPPQSCIVGIGRTVKAPRFDKNMNIVARDILKITISADHRSIDGSDAAKFLDTICQKLSNPIEIFYSEFSC